MDRVRANLNAAASLHLHLFRFSGRRNVEVERRVVQRQGSAEAIEKPRAHVLGRGWWTTSAFFLAVVISRVEDDLEQMGPVYCLMSEHDVMRT